MSFPAEVFRHVSRAGNPHHTGSGQQSGQFLPFPGRTNQSGSLQISFFPPQGGYDIFLWQPFYIAVSEHIGELKLTVPAGGQAAAICTEICCIGFLCTPQDFFQGIRVFQERNFGGAPRLGEGYCETAVSR